MNHVASGWLPIWLRQKMTAGRKVSGQRLLRLDMLVSYCRDDNASPPDTSYNSQ